MGIYRAEGPVSLEKGTGTAGFGVSLPTANGLSCRSAAPGSTGAQFWGARSNAR